MPLDPPTADTDGCVGVLLVNLGTPQAPTPAAVRRYLKEFLWDPRVVEIPRPLWWLILNLVVLNVRPRRVAEAYRSIWTDAGSPLMAITMRQVEGLAKMLAGGAQPVRVAGAMRYGEPSVASGLESLWADGARRMLILPLYPQYSGATTGSVFDALADSLKSWRWVPELRFVSDYHDHAAYITALAGKIRAARRGRGREHPLMFSFHGIPKRYQRRGDPYADQCLHTARRVAAELALAEEEWMVCFQSRFGREEWLQPYTDETLKALPAQGVRSVDVVCPGFAADCLETLEEMNIENRELFLEAGGEGFNYIPCLNDDAGHLEALGQIVAENVAGWGKKDP